MKKTLGLSIASIVLAFLAFIFVMVTGFADFDFFGQAVKKTLNYVNLFLFLLPIVILQILNIYFNRKGCRVLLILLSLSTLGFLYLLVKTNIETIATVTLLVVSATVNSLFLTKAIKELKQK